MARKKHKIGNVYIINDSILSRDNFYKPNRRVVLVRIKDNKYAYIKKIKSLYDSNGNLRKDLIAIEKYSDIRKPSGVHPKTYKKTKYNKPIKFNKLYKTKTRLNKWDRKKIGL